jgi:hypothetical protein
MIRKAAMPALAVVGLAAAALAIVLFVTHSSSSEPLAAPRTAAIIDQLALTSPDPAFASQAAASLQAAGYTVDYFPSDQVTVDFYRELPSRGYGLVIVRGHSGFALADPAAVAGEVRGQGDTFLFTSEPYTDEKYISDQRARRLSVAFYFDPTGPNQDPDAILQAFKTLPRYFGIKPGFIASSAKGRFQRTTVILMGCNGLSSPALAKAFVSKGAASVVGWDDLVSAAHTDAATERLLTHLLADNLSVDAAVAQTAAESGPDPTYGGKLTLYR